MHVNFRKKDLYRCWLTVLLLLGIMGTHLAQIPVRLTIERSAIDTVQVIEMTWSPDDAAQWHERNDGRLDIMSFSANISSTQLATSDEIHYQFAVGQLDYLELLIEIVFVAEGEEIYLWNVREHRKWMDLTSATYNRVLTPSFDPSQTYLVWKPNASGERKSRFTIRNLYAAPQRRGIMDIGFGTALACHPNEACKTDSIMQLISNTTVRMRLVMEEGIGWCSGSFINTTRNDKTPYVLTAYHCQFDYTPIYDMWRFDFNYTSSTCVNPVTEPPYFSMTGCQRIAGGQASDFLLLQLDEALPANVHVTFAGWNRDDGIIPDTVFHIHHPSADIRKFSTCTSSIVIHPNQIGWSQGYTTPANHHFLFKFTEGGHEPGSSGGPVFNPAGELIGQLHGGTSGCEAATSTFVGRFSKSWNLGPTPQERLRDWLDPDQTGVVRMQAIKNVSQEDIVDVQGIILDPLGRPVNNVLVEVSGSVEMNMTTGADGKFTLSGINRNGTYNIIPVKTDNPLNGLNALDLVGIQKHLLAKDTFDYAWQFMAGDPTNSGTITVGDLVMLLKLLLGKTQDFPTSPSWRFNPRVTTLSALPAGQPYPCQIMGIKIGDVNATSNPGL